MGAILRIVARYLIGYLAAKGILPQELLDAVAASPEAQAWIDGLVVALAIAIVEAARQLAKRFGWSL